MRDSTAVLEAVESHGAEVAVLSQALMCVSLSLEGMSIGKVQNGRI